MTAARAAGEAIARVYAGPFTVEHKSKDQPVTEADREANRIIREEIARVFPDDGWLSEETVDDGSRLQKKRVWIVDPLDGTKEFIAKIPEFAVSIGLAVEGVAVVGVIFNPATGELFQAAQGAGALQNGKPIRVSGNSDLSRAKILASRSETARGEWKPFEGRFQIEMFGGMAWKMALVASGRADGSFSLTPKNEWDVCAGALIVAEAGGIVTHPKGTPLLFNGKKTRLEGILYANPAIHEKLFKMLEAE